MRHKTFLLWLVIFLSFQIMAFAQGDILFSDTFTGTDGTHPAKWNILNAPQTGFWFLREGQFCTGNGDDLVGGDGYSYALINIPNTQSWTDYAIQCSSWIYQANGKVLLVARWVDERNHYEGVLESYKDGRRLRIEKVFNGERKTLVVAEDGKDGVVIPRMENGTSPADARLLKFTVAGSKLTLNLADLVTVEADDASFNAGGAGLGVWYHYVFFDDVIVQKIQPGAAAAKPISQIPTEIQSVSPPSTAASPTGTIFRVMIGEGLNDQAAASLRDQLVSWGYTPVELFQKEGGYDVYLGAFLSEAEAQTAKGFLQEEGLTPRKIVSLSGDKATEVRRMSAASSARKVYRVLAREFKDQDAADNMKKTLESDGYFPVEIAAISGNQRVYIGSFRSSEEADKLSKALKSDGYDFATVVEEEASERTEPISTSGLFEPTPASGIKQDIFLTDMNIKTEMEKLTKDEQEKVMGIVKQQEAVRGGDVIAQQIIDIKNQLAQLNKEQLKIVQTIRESREQEETRKKQIADLFIKIERSIDEDQLDNAKSFLEEVRKIDPANAKIDIKIGIIKLKSQKLSFEGEKYILQEEAKKIDQARGEAEQYEKEQKIQAALNSWNRVKSFAKPGSFDYTNASTAIGRIEGLIQKQQEEATKKEKQWRYTVYGIFGVILVLVLFLILMVVRSRKHDQELLRQVQELTLKPLLELQEGRAPSSIEDRTSPAQPAAASAMEATMSAHHSPKFAPAEPLVPQEEPEPVIAEQADVETESVTSVPPEEEIPGEEPLPEPASFGMGTLEEVEIPAPSMEDILSDKKIAGEPLYHSVSLDSLQDVEQEKPESQVPPWMKGPVKGPSVDIDDLFSDGIWAPEQSLETPQVVIHESPGEKFEIPAQKTRKPPDEIDTVEIMPLEKIQASPGGILPQKPFSASPVPPPPPKPAPAQTPKETPPVIEIPERVESQPAPLKPVEAFAGAGKMDNMVYEQDFDNEETGRLPANWKGDYSYASLVISDSSPAPASRKCIAFQKEKGAGSAFYCCHFPDTSGVMGIEFDVRCDKKNKYLLGFYVEKDEDYRYSVHTVIQYINSGKQDTKPSLRVQGKPVPYNWGEWRHIKYIVNLVDGTVDGYVDGVLVANGEKLASCPTSLNTISIRDNLATVGKLMIDNIKIYKA